MPTLVTALGARLMAAGHTLTYIGGTSPDAAGASDIDAAVAAARQSDVVIAALGDTRATAGKALPPPPLHGTKGLSFALGWLVVGGVQSLP